MKTSKVQIGKIKAFDKNLGVGEIESEYKIYLFTKKELQDQNITINDFVKFRAETIHGENKAYFIKRYDNSSLLQNDFLKPKKYISDEFI